MSCHDEVLKIGKKLEKMISSKDVIDSVALDLLKALKKQPMTLDVLQKTRVGITVNTLRKSCKNDETVSLAKALIKSWKKLLPEGASSSKSSTSVNRGLDDEDSSSQGPTSIVPDNTSQKSDSSSRDSEPSGTSLQQLQHRPAQTADIVRIKCRDLLANALRAPCDAEPAYDIEVLAAAIEDAVFNEFKNTEMKYKNKVRSRVANLKDPKNPRLREDVLLGLITPDRLISMTTEEMASDEMKQLRQKLTKEAINDHQMAHQVGTKSDLFKCGRCGHRDTMYSQVQTRSADEPMTTFVLCNHCGNRWKFC